MIRKTYICILGLLFCSHLSFTQSNCGCDGVDLSWLEEVKNTLTEEALNPPVTPCGIFTDIKQCTYLGQTVFVYPPTILPCDVGINVVDCTGMLVFSYGGFCGGPCPGDDQVQFLTGCESIYEIGQDLDVRLCSETDIPTLGEWAILCLSFLLLIVGILAIKDKRRKLSLNLRPQH